MPGLCSNRTTVFRPVPLTLGLWYSERGVRKERLMTAPPAYREQLLREVNALPEEYLPYVLQLVQTFRDSISLKPAAESLTHGWHEARTNQVTPLKDLWDGIDTE